MGGFGLGGGVTLFSGRDFFFFTPPPPTPPNTPSLSSSGKGGAAPKIYFKRTTIVPTGSRGDGSLALIISTIIKESRVTTASADTRLPSLTSAKGGGLSPAAEAQPTTPTTFPSLLFNSPFPHYYPGQPGPLPAARLSWPHLKVG